MGDVHMGDLSRLNRLKSKVNTVTHAQFDQTEQARSTSNSNWQEKYNGQTFKIAKALRTKLNRLQILNLWDNYFGEETDFLHTDLKSEKALTVMNDLGSMVESYFQGQPVHILGMLFFELCRMAVTWTVKERRLGDS